MNSKHSPSHDGFDPEDDLDERPPSRSMLKRASLALQELGQQLLDMPASRLAEIDMPERLRDALDGYKTTRSFEGKRRQIQFIGKVMRTIDAAKPWRSTSWGMPTTRWLCTRPNAGAPS